MASKRMPCGKGRDGKTNPDAIHLSWIKAHTCDDIAIQAISEDTARRIGIPREHIVCNRVADEAAKSLAMEIAPVDFNVFQTLEHEAYCCQLQLTLLNKMIGDELGVKADYSTKEEMLETGEEFSFSDRFPEWAWQSSLAEFSWTPTTSRHVDERLRQVFWG